MNPETIQRVEHTLLDAWVIERQGLTVVEIRAQCRLSETIIRRALKASTRVIQDVHKPVVYMSRTAPQRVHQMRIADAWRPTSEWLAIVIQETRREYDYRLAERRTR